MAKIVATLKTIFVAEVAQHNAAVQSAGKEVDTFVAKDTKVEAVTKKASESIKKQSEATENLRRKTNEAHISLTSFATILTTTATVPIALFAKSAFDAAVKMDGMMRGLRPVSGSAEAASEQLARLNVVAQLPGVGLNEAIKGSIQLQAAGLSAKQAAESIQSVGNALATVGKGKADLEGTLYDLTEMASLGKVQERQIRMLSIRMPQLRSAMVQAFGTADAEILQKAKITTDEFINKVIIGAIGKLPQIKDSIQNSLENMSIEMGKSLTRVGNALLPVASAIMTVLVPAMEAASKWFEELPKSTQLWMVALAGLVAAAGPLAGAIQLVTELTKALQEARLAILGPVGIIAALTLLAGFSVAGLINKKSDETITDAAKSGLESLKTQKKQLEAQILGVQEYLAAHKKDDMSSMIMGPINKKNYDDTIAELKGLQDELAKTEKAMKMMVNSQARVDAAAKTKAALAQTEETGRIDAAKRAKALEDAAKARKEAAAEAKRQAKERESTEESIADTIKKYSLSEFDYKIAKANEEYKHYIELGINKKTAEKWLALEIAHIWTEEGEKHQKALDEWEKSWKESEKKRIEATQQAQDEIARLTLPPTAFKVYEARRDYKEALKDKVIPKEQIDKLYALKIGEIMSTDMLKRWNDWIKMFEEIQTDAEEAAKALEPFTDRIKELNTEIALLTATSEEDKVALHMKGVEYKALTKDVQDLIDKIVKLQKVEETTAMAKSIATGIADWAKDFAKSLQGSVDVLSEDAKKKMKDPFTTFADDFGKEFIRSSRDIGRTFIKNLLSADPKARKDAIQNLMRELQNAFATTLSDALSKGFAPMIHSIGDQLEKALTRAAQGLQVSVLQAVTYVYGLLAAIGAQGKKRQTGGLIGAALGLGAALITGGAILPFIGAGAALGGAVAGGNPLEIIGAAAGAFAPGGAFDAGSSGGGGYSHNTPAPTRSVTINYHGPMTVNERSDIDTLARETASRLQQAALATG